jgi:XTP/dITP diphosphohydrolase
MTLVFATHNQNKIIEVQQLIGNQFELLGLHDIGCFEEIPETAATIEENAALKANYVSQKYGFDCFADDSGLEVFALNGAPGVFSGRYAGDDKNDEANMNKLLEHLHDKTNRQAQFKTVIALRLGDSLTLFTGTIQGSMAYHKTGSNGFGYDPIFIPEGHDHSFATLTLAEKNSISHRSKAIAQLISFLKKR